MYGILGPAVACSKWTYWVFNYYLKKLRYSNEWSDEGAKFEW